MLDKKEWILMICNFVIWLPLGVLKEQTQTH